MHPHTQMLVVELGQESCPTCSALQPLTWLLMSSTGLSVLAVECPVASGHTDTAQALVTEDTQSQRKHSKVGTQVL